MRVTEGGPAPGSLPAKTEAFLRDFFEKGESLVRDLIDENERLRHQLAQDRGQSIEPVGPGLEASEVVTLLMRRVGALERECDEIRRLAGNVEQASGDYRERLDALEAEHYHLACMFVAGSQFQSANTLEEVLRTITEVLLNFVGVGRFTVFLADEARQSIFALQREGAELRGLGEQSVIELDSPLLQSAARLGRPWVAGDPLSATGVSTGVSAQSSGKGAQESGGDEALGWLPLYAGSRLVGVVRLEAFLPQKKRFEDADQGLLALVSERAGIGIETAWIRSLASQAKETPLERETLENLVGA